MKFDNLEDAMKWLAEHPEPLIEPTFGTKTTQELLDESREDRL